MSDRPALVLEHEADSPPGAFADWADDRGIALEVFAWHGPATELPSVEGRPFIVILGSEACVFDDAAPWLARERALIDQAIRLDIPILGICFGGQHLALALGGTVTRAPRLEVGWLPIESLEPTTVPSGHYLLWHRDAFTVPPGAQLLARSPVAPQAFRHRRSLGVQFHPEVTPTITTDWAINDPESLAHVGLTVAAVDAATAQHAADACRRAHALFDAFLDGASG